jgi:hypothetical protein
MSGAARLASFALAALLAARASADTRWFRSDEMGIAWSRSPLE